MKQTKETLVTIGIPFYNAEKFLEFAIRSVLNQTYTNWELILLDDGSNDNSLMIAQSFVDKRIQVISDGVNKGLVYRLNQLTLLASGEYYARMDADDIMDVERISKQLNYLLEYPEVDVVGSDYYSIDNNNEIIGRRIQNIKLDSVKSILKYGCFAHPTIMGRTSWFKKNQYDKNCERMEDIELWIRTVSNNKFKNIPEPLLFYRNVGVPTLKKYSKSNFGIIRLFRQRKKYKITFLYTIYFQFIFLLKVLVYLCFFLLGKMPYLIQNRSKPLSKEEILKCSVELTSAISEISH